MPLKIYLWTFALSAVALSTKTAHFPNKGLPNGCYWPQARKPLRVKTPKALLFSWAHARAHTHTRFHRTRASTFERSITVYHLWHLTKTSHLTPTNSKSKQVFAWTYSQGKRPYLKFLLPQNKIFTQAQQKYFPDLICKRAPAPYHTEQHSLDQTAYVRFTQHPVKLRRLASAARARYAPFML